MTQDAGREPDRLRTREFSRPTGRTCLQASLVAVPLALFVGAGWAHRWIADDGFIYLRVVRQITSGNGPVFNSGERVEAFTSPLWVAILSIADIVTPIRLEWLAVGLGVGLSGAGLGLAVVGARTLSRRTDSQAMLVPFGLLVFVALLPTWVFQTSGLETGLTFAWEGGCLAILAGWAGSVTRRLRRDEMVVLGLGWLVRPELVLFSILFLVVAIVGQWRTDRPRDRAGLVATMVALPLGYQLFRMGYYGSLVASTAIAKESTVVRWGRGWAYFVDSTRPYALWLPALAIAIGGYVPLIRALEGKRARRGALVVAVFPIAGLLSALYVVAVGGDYVHARLLMPALFALCAPVAVIPATRQYVGALLVAPWVVVCALTLRPPQLFEGPSARATGATELWGRVTFAQYGWGPHGPHRRWYTGPHLYVQDRPIRRDYKRVDVPVAASVPLPTAVLRAVGLPSAAMGPRLHVLDAFGLGDSFTAHLETARRPSGRSRLPGHEKPLPSVWIVARLTREGSRAQARDFADRTVPLIPTTTGVAFDEQVAWARAALRCGDISRLMQSSEGAFGLHRFATNFIAAFRNTGIRIPPDPEQAYRRFCPAGTAPHIGAVGAQRTDAGERAVTDPSRRVGTLAFRASRRIGSDDPPAVRASTRPTAVGGVRARSPPRGEVGCGPDRSSSPNRQVVREVAQERERQMSLDADYRTADCCGHGYEADRGTSGLRQPPP